MIFAIGKHRLQHGNILDGIDELMDGKKADVIYVDPPWGQGNIKYWETLNHRHTGVERPNVSLNEFYAKLFDIFRRFGKNLFFLENGLRWNGYIKKLCGEYHVKLLHTVPICYRSGSKLLPHELHIIAKKAVRLSGDYLKSVANTHGIATVSNAISPFVVKDSLVLDPCCGVGLTARATKDLGGRFYGNELNGVRLDKTRIILTR